MSYGRKDVRGYVRARLSEIELSETDRVSTYKEHVEATKKFERQFLGLGLSICDESHLIRVAYRVAHSGRHQDKVWRVIARQLRREYKLPAYELYKLRCLGLEVAKTYKALVPFLVRGFWRG